MLVTGHGLLAPSFSLPFPGQLYFLWLGEAADVPFAQVWPLPGQAVGLHQ